MIEGLKLLRKRIFLSEAFKVKDKNNLPYFTKDLVLAYIIVLSVIFFVGVLLALILPIKSQDAIIFATALTAALVSFLGVQVNVFNKNKEYRERQLEKLVEEVWEALQSSSSFFQRYVRFFQDKNEVVTVLKGMQKNKEQLEGEEEKAKEKYDNAMASGDREYASNCKEEWLAANQESVRYVNDTLPYQNKKRKSLYDKYDECSESLQSLVVKFDKCATTLTLLSEVKGFREISKNKEDVLESIKSIKSKAVDLHNNIVKDSVLEIDANNFMIKIEHEKLLSFVYRLRQYELRQDDGFFGENSENVRQIAIVLTLVLTTASGYSVCKGFIGNG